MHKRVIAGIVLALLLSLPSVRADDGAASIAAGGIVMKRESRIVMAKEVLKISEDKVVVDYDFRNDSNQDVTTEVAFPIPPYSFDPDGADPKDAGFDDFKLWVDGRPAQYKREVRAVIGKNDATSILNQLHIDIASLGQYHWRSNGGPIFPDIARLGNSDRSRLTSLKLIDEDAAPLWTVQKKYYWSQTFPAHRTVHIRHEYTPVVGSSTQPDGVIPDSPHQKSRIPNWRHFVQQSPCWTN